MRCILALLMILMVACQNGPVADLPVLWESPPSSNAENSVALAADAATMDNLTLALARALAVQRSPSTAAAAAVMEQANARVEEARAPFRPTFSLATTATLNDSPSSFDLPGAGTITVRPQWQQSWTASGTLSLFDFGRDRMDLRASEFSAEAATCDAVVARQRLIHEVSLAWHRVHSTAANLVVSQETLALAEKQVQDADALVTAGKRTRDTLLTAAVDLLGRRQDLLIAQNAHLQAKRILNILLCRDADAATTLAAEGDAAGLPGNCSDLAGLRALAAVQNPALRASAERRRSIDASHRANALGARPTLGLTASGTRDSSASFGSPAESAQAVFSVNWPIVDGGRRAARDAGLSAQIMELRAQELKLLLQIETDLSRALLDLAEADSAIVLAAQSVSAAIENYRIVNERALAGTLSAREVLEARRTLAASRYAGTEAAFRRHTALAWIENLTGAAGN